jgi:hypothetical protein
MAQMKTPYGVIEAEDAGVIDGLQAFKLPSGEVIAWNPQAGTFAKRGQAYQDSENEVPESWIGWSPRQSRWDESRAEEVGGNNAANWLGMVNAFGDTQAGFDFKALEADEEARITQWDKDNAAAHAARDRSLMGHVGRFAKIAAPFAAFTGVGALANSFIAAGAASTTGATLAGATAAAEGAGWTAAEMATALAADATAFTPASMMSVASAEGLSMAAAATGVPSATLMEQLISKLPQGVQEVAKQIASGAKDMGSAVKAISDYTGIGLKDVLQLGGTVVSGYMGADAAKKAAAIQADSAQKALEESKRQFDIGQENIKPWLDTGRTSLAELKGGLGIEGAPTTIPGMASGDLTRKFTLQDFRDDPVAQLGQEFALKEGRNALTNAASARGETDSGNLYRELVSFGEGLGNQRGAESEGRFTNRQLRLYNMLANLAGMGQGAANTTVNAGNAQNQITTQLITGSGNAQAAGKVGAANSWSTAISGYINSQQNNALLERFLGSRGTAAAPASIPTSNVSGGGAPPVAPPNAAMNQYGYVPRYG